MRTFRQRLHIAVSAAALLSPISPVLAKDAAPAGDDKHTAQAQALVAQMTMEEKLGLIVGQAEPEETYQGQAGYLAGVPRLKIPALRYADGPPGILTKIPSSAPTATMGLAATFSKEDARLNGIIVADEAIRLGIDVALEPFVNIDRDITFARAYNTFGEDPLLTGTIGASVIQGIQSRGVMAQVKHFIGYDTNSHDVKMDMQTLHEVYLAPFDDAVKAGVSSIMCSYNRINGPYACGNKELQVDVLRGELGFKGFVTSDWGAVHDYDYMANGLDQEMGGYSPLASPFRPFTFVYTDLNPPAVPTKPTAKDYAGFANIMTRDMPEEPATKPFAGGTGGENKQRNLYNALKDGAVTPAMIDTAATRVLAQIVRFGYLDGSRERVIRTPSGVNIAATILKTGEDAAVLLKNDNGILPLNAKDSGSIALIGPTARQVASIGVSGERAVGIVGNQVGPYAALKQTMANADLRLAVGNDFDGEAIPAQALTQDGTKPGLAHMIEASPAGATSRIDFTGAKALPAGSNHTWEGMLTVPSAGRYILAIQTLGTRGYVEVDGKRVASTSGVVGGLHGDIVQAGQDGALPTTDGLNNARGAVELTAGAHKIRINAVADISGAPVQIRLNWSTPEKQKADRAAAIEAARGAKTAVVFAWTRGRPDFLLPGEQDQFISDVADANPNTVVVLNTSQPVALPWAGKVKAIVQMWWPGDEGGWATANVLSGKKNPAGRLPFTWANKLEDYAPNDPKHPERSGKDGPAVYSEGVDVGYRWFDRNGKAPLYPFGHGLSYTRFGYSDLAVSKQKGGGYNVSFTLRNDGTRDGEEVPQIYVSAPRKPIAGVQFAVNTLAGFDRVALKAGERKRVTITLSPRRTQYWSVAAKKWVDAPAGRTLSVGTSSRDLRLKTLLK